MNANGKSAVPSSIEHYSNFSVAAVKGVSGRIDRQRVTCQAITIEPAIIRAASRYGAPGRCHSAQPSQSRKTDRGKSRYRGPSRSPNRTVYAALT
jgi:hypothetical protein